MSSQVNTAGIALIKTFEGFANPVADDGFGNPTGGWGHTGGGIYNGEPVTIAQAEAWLESDLAIAGDGITKDLPGLTLNDNQFAALVALCFNSGTGDLVGTNLHALLMAQSWQAAADDILNFDHVGSQVVAGLLRRCEAERLLFLTPSGTSTGSSWVVVVGTQIGAQLFGDSAYAPLRPLCNALFGADAETLLGWDSASQSPSWNGTSISVPCRLIAGTAWAEVRPFAAWAGSTVSVQGETITLGH